MQPSCLSDYIALKCTSLSPASAQATEVICQWFLELIHSFKSYTLKKNQIKPQLWFSHYWESGNDLMFDRVVWYLENLQQDTWLSFLGLCTYCLVFDPSFPLSCSRKLVPALARKGLMGEALRHAVVKAMAKLQVLQIARNVWIFLLIFNTHLCEIFFLFFFFMQVNFVVCQLFALLAAVWFRTYLHSSKTSPFIRHVVATLLGLYLALFCFGW